MKGYFAKKNTEPKILKEFRVKSNDQYKEGNELGLEIFKDKKFLDVRSKTIGKGFASVEKWNFGGLRASHECLSFSQISWLNRTKTRSRKGI